MARAITVYFREWKIEATDRTATGTRGDQHFKLTRQPCFEEALRAVKQEVNEREGPQEWDMNYTNEALR